MPPLDTTTPLGARLNSPNPRGRAPAAVGRRLGRYRLIGPLGRGCQAVVWHADQIEPALGPVALKLLPPAFARDPRRRALLRQEAIWGARLEHPSLLPIYEYGEANGLAYLAMPLVAGRSLADVIRDRRAGGADGLARLPDEVYVPRVVLALAQVARALAAAHAGSVAHRDVKPANVLIEERGTHRSYLCDFGLVRDFGTAEAMPPDDSAGSPQYMAPEKLLGLGADDVLGDVYALGVTLYEAVTLRPPVLLPANLPRPRWRTFLATNRPVPPSVLCPGLSSELESAILCALAFDPARRHPSAAHLAEDLERLLPKAQSPRVDGPERGFAPTGATRAHLHESGQEPPRPS